MTFSICVREPYRGTDGDRHYRFGVAVTTRLPGVGALCPFVSEHGAVVVQSHVSQTFGQRCLSYLADGLAVDDAVQAVLNAESRTDRRNRQIHGVDTETSVAITGEGCVGYAGQLDGEQFTVAGNLLTDQSVLTETASAYEADAFGDRPLAERLIDALAAGQNAGGDKREALSIQSAALKVVTTEPSSHRQFYNDLRVDATETPIADLTETYNGALLGYEQSLDAYGDADTSGDDVEHIR